MKTRAVVCLFGLFALTACSSGGGTRASIDFGAYAPPHALLFVQFDTDGDGVTRAGEFDRGAGASWAALAGGARTVRALDFQDWAGRALGRRDAAPGFLTFDVDRDDNLTEAEFRAGLQRIFAMMDYDRDGDVSRSEMLSEAAPIAAREPRRGPSDVRRVPRN